jgi:hypothetical protein
MERRMRALSMATMSEESTKDERRMNEGWREHPRNIYGPYAIYLLYSFKIEQVQS